MLIIIASKDAANKICTESEWVKIAKCWWEKSYLERHTVLLVWKAHKVQKQISRQPRNGSIWHLSQRNENTFTLTQKAVHKLFAVLFAIAPNWKLPQNPSSSLVTSHHGILLHSQKEPSVDTCREDWRKLWRVTEIDNLPRMWTPLFHWHDTCEPITTQRRGQMFDVQVRGGTGAEVEMQWWGLLSWILWQPHG